MCHRFDPDHIKTIDPDLSLATLKHNLESQQATLATKLETLEKIKTVSEEQSGSESLGTSKIKTSLCCLIEAIATSLETKEFCEMLGQNQGFLQELIGLLHLNSGASDAGIKAISALCCSELNQESFIAEGLIDGLVMYISSINRGQTVKALATLELLLSLENGREAVINNTIVIHVLVKMVFRVSNHEVSESAVSLLLIICYESLKAREKAISARVLTQLLLLLQSQCSFRAKNKARLLLKLLRSVWAEDPTVCKLQYGLVDT
ncbi:hypothetical protein NE237_026947 [Protea cynaroides]|uniref:U-box domain-containing protein n=1 Tax=Protea cynaroides TaxID=273540 RepID=A0A9Q0GMG4_9MAGN|nr:hypothetical protein NE237_026947 [Protea cynaroides]